MTLYFIDCLYKKTCTLYYDHYHVVRFMPQMVALAVGKKIPVDDDRCRHCHLHCHLHHYRRRGLCSGNPTAVTTVTTTAAAATIATTTTTTTTPVKQPSSSLDLRATAAIMRLRMKQNC